MFGNIFDDPEPTWTGLYTCNAVPTPTGYCNAKFDADVADNQPTLDPSQRIADIKDAQKQFYADVPTLLRRAPVLVGVHRAQHPGLPLRQRRPAAARPDLDQEPLVGPDSVDVGRHPS